MSKVYKNGRCIFCGHSCYIECRYCYVILNFPGQPHNCPVDDSTKRFGLFATIQCCSTCEKHMNVHWEQPCHRCGQMNIQWEQQCLRCGKYHHHSKL